MVVMSISTMITRTIELRKLDTILAKIRLIWAFRILFSLRYTTFTPGSVIFCYISLIGYVLVAMESETLDYLLDGPTFLS